MTLTPCAPCSSCIPGTIGNDKFKQDVETILCQILEAIEAGGGLTSAVNLTAINGVSPVAVNNGTANTGTLRVTIASDSTGVIGLRPPTSVGSGQKSVAAAGTDEPLAGSTACQAVIIKAKGSNTGNVYVGSAGVSSATGYILDANEFVAIDIDNLADISIDVDVNGEGVSYLYNV